MLTPIRVTEDETEKSVGLEVDALISGCHACLVKAVSVNSDDLELTGCRHVHHFKRPVFGLPDSERCQPGWVQTEQVQIPDRGGGATIESGDHQPDIGFFGAESIRNHQTIAAGDADAVPTRQVPMEGAFNGIAIVSRENPVILIAVRGLVTAKPAVGFREDPDHELGGVFADAVVFGGNQTNGVIAPPVGVTDRGLKPCQLAAIAGFPGKGGSAFGIKGGVGEANVLSLTRADGGKRGSEPQLAGV